MLMTVLVAVAAVVAGAVGVAHVLAPVRRPPTELGLLAGQRRELARKVAESHALIEEKEELVGELRALQARMRAVDARLYRLRLERMDAGIALLERQVRVEHELIDEYERADRMLDVEMETLRVSGRLEEEAVEQISARLAELDGIREANRELELLLEANEEIERFLLGRGDDPDALD